MLVVVDAQAHLDMEMGADGNAGHADATNDVGRLHASANLGQHLTEVTIEQVDVHLAAGNGQLLIEADDHGVTVKAVIWPQQFRISGPAWTTSPVVAA